jgi:hypothetical protein
VASGDREQEMITEFFPQIQDSTEIDASSRSGGLGCQTWHGLSSPWLGNSRSHRLKWGQEDFMGRKIFRRTSPSFAVGLVVPSHPRGCGLGRRSTGLPESGAAICGVLNLWA